MKLRIWLASLISIIAIPSAFALDTYQLDSEHSYVNFKISHFGFSKPTGKWFANGELLLDETHPENSKVNITIDVASIVTGITALDDHLRSKDFFDVKKYPRATFVSHAVNLKDKEHAEVSGVLTVHGVSKPVTLQVKLNRYAVSPMTDKLTAGFTATAQIKRSEFGITTYLPGLGDEVELAIEVEAARTA